MILFGALALVSTLFERLGLSDARQALALPEGSIRAAIALALIVLFAIVSIMLYQSLSDSKPYVITGVAKPAMTAMLQESTNRVIAVVPECRPAAALDDRPVDCATYAVHVAPTRGREATDLAKQLLILIGTLMTSVTSFYFASRAAEPTRSDGTSKPSAREASPDAETQTADTRSDRTDTEINVDGCNVRVVDPTPDDDLPPARGRVA